MYCYRRWKNGEKVNNQRELVALKQKTKEKEQKALIMLCFHAKSDAFMRDSFFFFLDIVLLLKKKDWPV